MKPDNDGGGNQGRPELDKDVSRLMVIYATLPIHYGPEQPRIQM